VATSTYPAKTGVSNSQVFSSYTLFPAAGTPGVLYLDTGNADLYLWTGSAYELQSGSGAGAGADTALSNLTATAINQSLVPDTADTYTVGDNTKPWLSGYFSDVRANNTGARVDLSTGALQSGSTVKLDWSGTDLSVNTRKITDVSDPTAAQDVATKAYADTKVANPHTPTGFWSQMPTFPNSLNYFIQEYDYFTIQVSNAVGDMYAPSGGASAAIQLRDASETMAQVNSTEKALGVTCLNAGSTSTGRAALGFGGAQSAASLRFGQQELIFGVRQHIWVLGTVTENFTMWTGFMDIITAAPTRGCFFRYNYAVNSGRWEFCTVDGGATTATDTGVAPTAGVYQVMEIKVNRAGTSVTFYIDGTLVGTITSGIPTGTTGLLAMSSLIRSAGVGTGGSGNTPIDAIYMATEKLSAR
jgi:hypothetical protein